MSMSPYFPLCTLCLLSCLRAAGAQQFYDFSPAKAADAPEPVLAKKARFVWFLMQSRPLSRVKISNLPRFRHPEKGNYYNVFFNYFLKDCHIDALDIKDFQLAADTNNDAVVRHYLEPGSTFLIPVYDKNPESGWAKVLLDIFAKYNVSTQEYSLIHTSDETLDYKHPALIKFYLKWKKVYRQNWWKTPDFQRLRAENRLDWFPLHHLKMTDLAFSDMLPASQRTINITFRGNVATNTRRKPQVAEVERALDTEINGQVFKSGSFSTDASGSAYESDMLNSRLCLNIRGRTPECHRFYETLEFGCIPVFVDVYRDFDYRRQFSSWKSQLKEVPWRKGNELPFIWVKNVAALKREYARLLLSGEEGLRELDRVQRECAEWWEAAKLYMKRRFEEAVCTYQG